MRRLAIACAVATAIVVVSPMNAAARLPKKARVALRSANKHIKAGDRQRAIESLMEGFAATAEPALLLRMAAIEKEMGRFEAAWGHLDGALGHPKTNDRLRKNVVKMLEELEPWHTSQAQQREAAMRARQAAQRHADQRAQEQRQAAAERKRLLAEQRASAREREALRRERVLQGRREQQAAVIRSERSWKSAAGWSAVGVGAVVTCGGGLLLARYFSGQKDLDSRLGAANSAGRFENMDHTTYKAEQEALNVDASVAVAGLAGGAVAATAGVLLLASRPSQASVSLAPRLGGGILLVRTEF